MQASMASPRRSRNSSGMVRKPARRSCAAEPEHDARHGKIGAHDVVEKQKEQLGHGERAVSERGAGRDCHAEQQVDGSERLLPDEPQVKQGEKDLLRPRGLELSAALRHQTCRVVRIGVEVALNASDVMSSPVIVVGPDAPLREVARTLAERKISAVPVVEGERRGGIVSEADVLRRGPVGPVMRLKREIPTTPSLPVTAISADAPFSSTYSNETILSVGK